MCRMQRFDSHLPPSAYTFGWNILLTNRTEGGLFGYSSVKAARKDKRRSVALTNHDEIIGLLIVSLNVPSSNGVSAGPNMTAFHCMILLSHGAPLTPAGGSSCNLLRYLNFPCEKAGHFFWPNNSSWIHEKKWRKTKKISVIFLHTTQIFFLE